MRRNRPMVDYDPQRFRDGELAYDIMQGSPVVVTDAATPTVGDLDPAMRNKVYDSHGNQLLAALGLLDDETPTAEVAFTGTTSAASTGYTYPVTRLVIPDVTEVTDGLTPAQHAKASVLSDLFYEYAQGGSLQAEGFAEVCKRAGIESTIVEAAARTVGVEPGEDNE